MTDTTNGPGPEATLDLAQQVRQAADTLLQLLRNGGADDCYLDSDRFVHQLLAAYRKIALIWCVEDVQSPLVRPDLTAEQAWEVLERAWDKHDADWGISWTTLDAIADDWFPEGEGVEP